MVLIDQAASYELSAWLVFADDELRVQTVDDDDPTEVPDQPAVVSSLASDKIFKASTRRFFEVQFCKYLVPFLKSFLDYPPPQEARPCQNLCL
jgi:hypothetical protein